MASLKRIMAAVRGVDPINFGPALLADYRCEAGRRADVSPEAWSYFMTTIRAAGAGFSVSQAWRDVRDVARVRGWSWPSLPTVHRAWSALPDADRLLARHGRESAVKGLAQPALRDKTSIGALEWVPLALWNGCRSTGGRSTSGWTWATAGRHAR